MNCKTFNWILVVLTSPRDTLPSLNRAVWVFLLVIVWWNGKLRMLQAINASTELANGVVAVRISGKTRKCQRKHSYPTSSIPSCRPQKLLLVPLWNALLLHPMALHRRSRIALVLASFHNWIKDVVVKPLVVTFLFWKCLLSIPLFHIRNKRLKILWELPDWAVLAQTF